MSLCVAIIPIKPNVTQKAYHTLIQSTIVYITTKQTIMSEMAATQFEENLLAEMNELNNKVFYACTQVKMISQQIDLLNIRYKKALTNERHSFRYSLRLRLATYEGMRDTILKYARMTATKMDTIEEMILSQRNV